MFQNITNTYVQFYYTLVWNLLSLMKSYLLCGILSHSYNYNDNKQNTNVLLFYFKLGIVIVVTLLSHCKTMTPFINAVSRFFFLKSKLSMKYFLTNKIFFSHIIRNIVLAQILKNFFSGGVNKICYCLNVFFERC